jgi:hypothetical protein
MGKRLTRRMKANWMKSGERNTNKKGIKGTKNEKNTEHWMKTKKELGTEFIAELKKTK